MKLLKEERIGQIRINKDNYEAECINYINANKIVFKFSDGETGTTTWSHFDKGEFKYKKIPNEYGGINSNIHKVYHNGKISKEYDTWRGVLERSTETPYYTYENVTICKEWLIYDNFYDWLHNESNFNKWINMPRSSIDKDIIKYNKIYSPETCFLVPHSVNCLFTKSDSLRGLFPIGVYYKKDSEKFVAQCHNPKRGMQDFCGYYNNPQDAFYLGYKPYKEKLIKQIAQEEYDKGNITKRCYDAMMKYEVEITD